MALQARADVCGAALLVRDPENRPGRLAVTTSDLSGQAAQAKLATQDANEKLAWAYYRPGNTFEQRMTFISPTFVNHSQEVIRFMALNHIPTAKEAFRAIVETRAKLAGDPSIGTNQASSSGPGQVGQAARARRGLWRRNIRRQSATSSPASVIAYARVSMNTTLVVNAKGGVGKTTIATNLASYFASRGAATTIADFDPQGSSLNWIRQRPADAARIAGADLAQRVGVGLPTGRRQIPLDTRQLIIDAPAGPSRLLLQDLLARAPHSILIPVAPSSIDIHATANFIRELLLVGHVRLRSTRVAVLANRVSGDRPVYEPLERFASAMKISFIARVSDSRVYVDAAEAGMGVFDMPAERCGAEQREFLPIARWAQGGAVPEEHYPGNVVPFRSATV